VVSKTLYVRPAAATGEVAEALDLPLGAPAVLIRRLFIVDDEPFSVFDHHLRPVIAIENLRAAGQFQSLYQLMAQEGVAPAEAAESVTAAMLAPEDAELLGIAMPGAVLLRRRVAYGVDRVPVEYTVYRIRPDRYSMDIEFLRSGR
jgi:GntR family transcriptional regulator